jgi:hypothetical protein
MRRIVVLVVGFMVLGVLPAQAGEPDKVNTLYRGSAAPDVQQPAAPDVVRQGTCSGQSLWRLGLTGVGDEIRVRLVLHRIPEASYWRIVLRHGRAGPDPFNYGDGRVFFEGVRSNATCCDPEVEVKRRVRDLEGDDGFAAKAVDQQTGEVCKALGVIQE